MQPKIIQARPEHRPSPFWTEQEVAQELRMSTQQVRVAVSLGIVPIRHYEGPMFEPMFSYDNYSMMLGLVDAVRTNRPISVAISTVNDNQDVMWSATMINGRVVTNWEHQIGTAEQAFRSMQENLQKWAKAMGFSITFRPQFPEKPSETSSVIAVREERSKPGNAR